MANHENCKLIASDYVFEYSVMTTIYREYLNIYSFWLFGLSGVLMKFLSCYGLQCLSYVATYDQALLMYFLTCTH